MFKIDHDLHVHSSISLCSGDPSQTPERILRYAKDNGFTDVCITDHFWDETVHLLPESWYVGQGLSHVSAALPLPAEEGVRFLFGCETELDRTLTLGVHPSHFDLFDFIIIPTTHFHMNGFTVTAEEVCDPRARVNTWIKRFDAVLNMDLPFNKVGIAHLTCTLIAPNNTEEYLETMSLLPQDEMKRLFKKAAMLGVGIELNMKYPEENTELLLRPYVIAKECGCKFYLGSDAHTSRSLDYTVANFEKIVSALSLDESDKFHLS